MPRRYTTLLVAILLLVASGARTAEAVDPPDIGSLQSAVREAPELSEEEREPLLTTLQEAQASLDRLDEYAAQAAEYRAAMESGKEEIASLEAKRDELEGASAGVEALLGPDPTLDEIEAEIEVVEAELRALTAERAELLEKLAEDASAGGTTQDRLVEVKAAIADLEPAADEHPAELPAKVGHAAAIARLAALRAEEELLELKLRGGPALTGVRNARAAWLTAAIQHAEARLAALRDAAAGRRTDLVEQELASTQALAERFGDLRPALAAYADRNMELVRAQRTQAERIRDTRDTMAGLRAGLAAIEEDANLTRRRLEIAGLEAELGQVLLQRLTSMPEPRAVTAAANARNALIAEVSVSSIRHDEELRKLEDRRAYLLEEFPDIDSWKPETREALNSLFQQRRELLREHISTENTLLGLLVDSNEAAEALAKAMREYEEYLTGNLLWIRNYNYVDPRRLLTQLQALTDPRGLSRLAAGLPRALPQPAVAALALLTLLLIAARPKLRRHEESLLSRPLRPREERTRFIFRGLVLALLLALPAALAVLTAGMICLGAAQGSTQLTAIGSGLAWSAMVLFAFDLLRRLTRRLGVGRRLLKWNSQKIEALRRDLRWAEPLMVGAQFTAVAAQVASANDSGGALGALATLLVATVLCVYCARALRSGLYQNDRLGRITFQAGFALGVAVVIMHVTGHLFAAHLYLRAAGLSIVAVLLALLVTNVLQRVLMIYRSRLERRAREELRSQEAAEDPVTEEGEDLETVASLSEAHRQLLGLTRLAALALPLWFIWAPALPALQVLNTIGLWSVTDATLPEGQLRTVSLATLIIAAIVIAVTTLVTRHLPPLVKVLLMEWGKVSAGARYAAGMLLQYVIIGIGASVTLSMLGWEWSKVQWLVAALGVGIGFGLQEIVANFISGLILLFERPIRPGDIISVGTNDGTVTEINPRATIIESFEGKELMIPNKDLITGTVINWSLSSSKLRVVIPVGVAYGTDVREAMRILVEVAKDNPSVLEDPPPVATFEDFGDNALNLWLRCFAEKDYIRVWTELRTEINDRYNAAGISISFPQRDVHLDAARPIPVQVVTERPTDTT